VLYFLPMVLVFVLLGVTTCWRRRSGLGGPPFLPGRHRGDATPVGPHHRSQDGSGGVSLKKSFFCLTFPPRIFALTEKTISLSLTPRNIACEPFSKPPGDRFDNHSPTVGVPRDKKRAFLQNLGIIHGIKILACIEKKTLQIVTIKLDPTPTLHYRKPGHHFKK